MIHVANNLWRGPRPNPKDLLDAGINKIISLESGIYELAHDDRYENWYPTDYGVEFYDIGCSDFLPPEPEKVLKVMDIIMGSSQKIYIHCLAGKDRTGFMCAVYRMKLCGWSYEQAIDEMDRLGFHWWYFWWKPFLKIYKNYH